VKPGEPWSRLAPISRGRYIAVLGTVALLTLPVACGSSRRFRPVDGIPCTAETLRVHYHSHLTLLSNGRNVPLPARIGIRDEECLYSLHTHKRDGIIHIEAPAPRTFTLGQFFDIWGKPLSVRQADGLSAPSGQTLHFFVNGRRYTGDPREIRLARHQRVTIEAGREVPPPQYTFPSGV
jgi:hypothetical protein